MASSVPKAKAVEKKKKPGVGKKAAKRLTPKPKPVVKRKKPGTPVSKRPAKRPKSRRPKSKRRVRVVPIRTKEHEWALARARLYRRLLRRAHKGVFLSPKRYDIALQTYGNLDGTVDSHLILGVQRVRVLKKVGGKMVRVVRSIKKLSTIERLLTTLAMGIRAIKWPKGTCQSFSFTFPPETVLGYNRGSAAADRLDPKSYLRLRGLLRVALKWRIPSQMINSSEMGTLGAALQMLRNLVDKFGILPSEIVFKLHSSHDGTCKRASH